MLRLASRASCDSATPTLLSRCTYGSCGSTGNRSDAFRRRFHSLRHRLTRCPTLDRMPASPATECSALMMSPSARASFGGALGYGVGVRRGKASGRVSLPARRAAYSAVHFNVATSRLEAACAADNGTAQVLRAASTPKGG